jgi:hypothetical protein
VNINELTLDMVRSYADACRQLHDHASVLQGEGFGLVVIPSRGAHPFIQGADHYDFETRSRTVPVPAFQRLDRLYLPFTADVGDEDPFQSKDIRRYWSRTLAAIVRRDRKDIAFRLHEFLRQKSKGLAIGDTTIKAANSEKFIFVDTVVSGQAISEIFHAFKEYGLSECHFLLLFDQRGAGLKPEYKRDIDEMAFAQRATIIPVEKIFTEDEGPAMSGIWTVTFPDLMEQARKMVPELADSREAAAGLYYFEIARREDTSNIDFTISNGILFTMISSAVANRDSAVEMLIQEFKKHMATSKLQDQARTKHVADTRILTGLPVDSTDISGSHVIRAKMDPQRAEKFMRDFLKT